MTGSFCYNMLAGKFSGFENAGKSILMYTYVAIRSNSKPMGWHAFPCLSSGPFTGLFYAYPERGAVNQCCCFADKQYLFTRNGDWLLV